MPDLKGKQRKVCLPPPTANYPNVRLHWLILASFSPIPPAPEKTYLNPNDLSWKACFPQWFWGDPDSDGFKEELKSQGRVKCFEQVAVVMTEVASLLESITDHDLQQQDGQRLAREIGRRQAAAEASCGVSDWPVPEHGKHLLVHWLRSPPWTDFNAYRELGREAWNSELEEDLQKEEEALQSLQNWTPDWGTKTSFSPRSSVPQTFLETFALPPPGPNQMLDLSELVPGSLGAQSFHQRQISQAASPSSLERSIGDVSQPHFYPMIEPPPKKHTM